MLYRFLCVADDGGEEDSFVGQSNVPSAPMNYFQPTTSSAPDPFANVGHNPLPTNMSAPPPVSEARLPTAVVPPVGHSLQSAVPPPSAMPNFGTLPLMGASGAGANAGMAASGVSSGLPPTLPSMKTTGIVLGVIYESLSIITNV